jgi:hypothetical protein
MTRSLHSVRAKCAAVLIAGTLLGGTLARAQSNPSPSREQVPKLLGAERIVDSVMNRVHQTYDFEPLLLELFAPDVPKALREHFKAGPNILSDRDLLRAYISLLTMLYVGQLWKASLEMNGVDVESESYPDDLPPDLKVPYQKWAEAESRAQSGTATTADLREALEMAIEFRTAIIKQIRPDVFTSEPYKRFLKQYPDHSRVSPPSDSGEETAYDVQREGLSFTLVDRAGAIKIVGVAAVWLD